MHVSVVQFFSLFGCVVACAAPACDVEIMLDADWLSQQTRDRLGPRGWARNIDGNSDGLTDLASV